MLVHGLGASVEWWRPTVPRLASTHRVLLVDVGGFGRARRQSVRLDDAAAVLADWIRQVVDEPVALVGHSMGGFVAADLTIRHPELVERLVLVDAAGLLPPAPISEHLRNLARGGRRSPLRLAPLVFLDAYRAGLVAIARGGHQVLAMDLASELERIDVPTLVIWGEQDVSFAFKFSDDLMRALPHARLIPIADAAHLPQLETPTTVNTAVSAFLRGR